MRKRFVHMGHMSTSTPLWTRRRLLRTVFCSSAALALNIKSQSLAATEGEDLHWLALGDFGSQEPAQTAVAQGMQNYVARLQVKPSGLLLLGDNFYKPMPGGLQSPRWQTGFEDMYPRSSFDCPCPVVLGNHDYHDNKGGEQVQLAYAKKSGTRWTFPNKWHRMDFPTVNPLVTMLFTDTNTSVLSGGVNPKTKEARGHLTPEEEAAQLEWLKGELAKPRAPFTIVVGHHPVYSNGIHGDSKQLVANIGPLLQTHGVHAYLCGHDHDMQHLELEGLKTSFILSGGGGARVRELPNHKRQMPFGQPIYGFTHLQASPQRLIFRQVDANGKQMHAFEKRLDGSFSVLG
ncbi:MAG: hypothetical protein JWO94_567 [Verrucomicrobiaceae bacterium]|nr:hypothetical protein [Verrucomicrobiaceae bacterium]